MRASKAADLPAMREQLVAALAQGTAAIETPQLGRVEFRTVAEIQAAIAWIDAQVSMSAPSTFVFQSHRGTGKGDCRQ